MNKLLTIILSATFLLVSAQVAAASGTSNCSPIYGGGQVCQPNMKFTIDKLVQKPGGNFVDNLTINDSLIAIGQDVVFQLKIKNTGDVKIEKIDVTDTLPAELSFVSGPGNYNSSNNTITFKIENLEEGREVVYFITAKVVGSATLCPVNAVRATAAGQTAEDLSSFCIPTSVPQIMPKVPMKTIPQTGPEEVLFSLPILAAAGFYIRKKTGL